MEKQRNRQQREMKYNFFPFLYNSDDDGDGGGFCAGSDSRLSAT